MPVTNLPYFYMSMTNSCRRLLVIQPMLPFIAIAGLFIGLLLVILPPIIENHIIMNCCTAVDAEIKGRKEVTNKGITYAYLIWRYEYKGEEYFHFDTIGRADESRQIGQGGILIIDKYKPEKVYRFMTNKSRLMLKVIGIIIIAISLLGLNFVV